MSWNEFMALVLLIEIMVVIGMLIWAIPAIIDGIIKTKRRKRFGKEISRLFEKTTLNRTQIEVLAKEYFLNSKDIQLAAREEFKDSLSVDEPSKEKTDYFQDLYQDYERDEPFEGLPSDVRLHLERVRESLGKDKDHMLQPLASQLQDLNDENVRKHKKMWWVSVASLMIGVASLAFAAYAYYKPSTSLTSETVYNSEHNKQIQPTAKSGG